MVRRWGFGLFVEWFILVFLHALFWRFARTDSRPCVVSSAFLADESLSLACARESNQREHTHTAAVAGHQPGDFARTLRRFADGTSLCRQRTRAHRARAPSGFFLRDLAAAERDR